MNGPSAHRTTIRVLVADDHPVVRQGLCTMLEIEDDIVVVARAGDGEEAIRLSRETRPDIVLLDVQMPNTNGIEALKRIRAEDPAAKVIVLTTYRNEDYLFPSLQAGARAYLLKDSSREELADAVRRVARGESLLDPEVLRGRRPRSGGGERELTAREVEVLQLMAQGRSNGQIAAQLFVSENTVKTHVSNILAKLGAADRAGAVSTAHKQRLIA
ncbi:MAG: response regulator transcription factor [Candidatus Dormibacteria bacterium]